MFGWKTRWVQALGQAGLCALAAGSAQAQALAPLVGPGGIAPTAAPAGSVSWVQTPTAEQMAAAYPKRMLDDGVNGAALLKCGLGAAGEPTGCVVAYEYPAGRDFGAAALKLVPAMRLARRSGEGAVAIAVNFREPERPGGVRAVASIPPETRAASNQYQTAQNDLAKARKGDSASMVKMGDHFVAGQGALLDLVQAAGYYQLAADKGSAPGMTRLGLAYLDGAGLDRDPVQAVRWLQGAADKKEPQAMLELGRFYAAGQGGEGTAAQALGLIQASAEAGNVAAMGELGEIYQAGALTPADLAQSASWNRKAADKGDPFAMFEMGVAYANGEGVKADRQKAIDWFTKAARKADGALKAKAQQNADLLRKTG